MLLWSEQRVPLSDVPLERSYLQTCPMPRLPVLAAPQVQVNGPADDTPTNPFVSGLDIPILSATFSVVGTTLPGAYTVACTVEAMLSFDPNQGTV